MNTKKKYIAPEMSEFYYRVEIGFVNSLLQRIQNDQYLDNFDQNNQQYWHEEEHFGGTWNW